MIDVIERAVRDKGLSISALAREIGITPSAIFQWDQVPAERVLKVESFTGVSRHVLRPDLYPVQESA